MLVPVVLVGKTFPCVVSTELAMLEPVVSVGQWKLRSISTLTLLGGIGHCAVQVVG